MQILEFNSQYQLPGQSQDRRKSAVKSGIRFLILNYSSTVRGD